MSHYLYIAATLLLYYLASMLQTKLRWVLLHPILITVTCIICFLTYFDLPVKQYEDSVSTIDFLLKPAVVCLAYPLYKHWEIIRKQWLFILLAQLVGCVLGITSVMAIAYYLGAPEDVIFSLAPKSASSPIAIEISKGVHGIPSLTASIAISVGIFGAVFGYRILEMAGVKNPISMSLGMGSASHAIGTSKSFGISNRFGVFSTIALILQGVFTALLTPLFVKLFSIYLH